MYNPRFAIVVLNHGICYAADLALTMIMQSTKRHLTKKLENLDWKLDEQKEISKLITNDVGDIVSGSDLDTRGLVINMY